MSLLAWIPPAALAERALGPDVGGGRPSLRTGCTRADGSTFWSPTETSAGGVRDLFAPNAPVALLLSLDGAPCALSLMRAAALLLADESLAHTNEGGLAWRRRVLAYLAMPPAGMARLLVERLGGELVEVT